MTSSSVGLGHRMWVLMVRLGCRDAAVRLANAPGAEQWIEIVPLGQPFQATGIDDPNKI